MYSEYEINGYYNPGKNLKLEMHVGDFYINSRTEIYNLKRQVSSNNFVFLVVTAQNYECAQHK
jgi:hypothetical protein